MATIPETVAASNRGLYVQANDIRAAIKLAASLTFGLLSQAKSGAAPGEAIANATLAYRHLEDASMRLGKMLQALDGGVSVYDKTTTVDVQEPAAAPAIPVNRTGDGDPIHDVGSGG